ncbi:MAG: histone deacetylase family protein [Trueperaceae bacterium]|nr:histone deacetylase family protein [Trueperaceae bacterium]
MLVVTAPDTARHDPSHELDKGQVVSPVWERAARYDAIAAAVADAELPMVAPRHHHGQGWERVHEPALVAWLHSGWRAWRDAGGPEVLIPDTFAHRAWPDTARRPTSPIGVAGWWVTDTATPIVEGSWTAAVAAVDAALTAVDLVATGEADRAHALTRPPGHHAGPGHIGGFCLVNHAAIAASALREATGERVAVLDIDHHHGNGTQEVFLDDASVLYVSLHADPATSYPWCSGFTDEVGTGAGRGATLNLPLPEGTDDDAYLTTLERAVEAVAAHEPGTVVLSLGTDTADSDPVGGLGLSTDAYPRIGRTIADLGLPVVSVQEGGYDLDRVGRDTVGVLRALG